MGHCSLLNCASFCSSAVSFFSSARHVSARSRRTPHVPHVAWTEIPHASTTGFFAADMITQSFDDLGHCVSLDVCVSDRPRPGSPKISVEPSELPRQYSSNTSRDLLRSSPNKP
jgi:hypothetical protein